jgi:type IV secretion system protein VirB9
MSIRILLFGLLACVGVQAAAEESPIAGQKDPRMRSIAYDPNQVVRLSTGVGATLVVTFSANEKISAVAVTDSKDLAANPRENFLFMKSKNALPPQPVVVLTEGPKGLRRYVFEVETVPMAGLTADKSDLYYSVEFIYPGDAAAARAMADKKRLAERREHAAEQQEHAAEDALTRAHDATQNPLIGPPNWHYVGEGDHTLLPLEVLDNGYSTAFRFPGNTRIPGIFRLNPDGKESTANYSVKGGYVIVGTVAAGWRLRDGNTVLCIWNRAYDKIGASPDTGTTSPDVKRTTKESPK